jgi:4-hydroxy-tetrahydrodipicolinate synthase
MLDLSLLRGIYPPVLTPLTPDERVDVASLRTLVGWLIDEGVHGIWALGTTAEFPCLDAGERQAALEATVEAANGRVPVVANVSDAGTQLAIRHARVAKRAEVDAIAVTPPYYYPHTMDEMLAHYRAVRDAIDLPLLIYNIPQTVKVRMEVGTTLKLAEEGTVVGIKDSQNDLQWFRDVCLGARERGLSFRAFLGTRTLIDAAVQIGGVGSIPSIANVAPRDCAECHEAAERGDFAAAARAQERVIAYEQITTIARSGSANAATLAGMKSYLRQRGIIAHSTVAGPLRPLTADEEAQVGALAGSLPQAVAVGT